MPKPSKTDNVRKRCACRKWMTCSHPWYLDFAHEKIRYRDNLDKLTGRHAGDFQMAKDEARRAIQAKLDGRDPANLVPSDDPTLAQLLDAYLKERPRSNAAHAKWQVGRIVADGTAVDDRDAEVRRVAGQCGDHGDAPRLQAAASARGRESRSGVVASRLQSGDPRWADSTVTVPSGRRQRHQTGARGRPVASPTTRRGRTIGGQRAEPSAADCGRPRNRLSEGRTAVAPVASGPVRPARRIVSPRSQDQGEEGLARAR